MKDMTFDDLVDAYFSAAEWGDAAPELRDYHVLRRDLLEALFGCTLEEPAADPKTRAECEAERDRRTVARVARSCLAQAAAMTSPFGVYLEGGPGPMEAAVRLEHNRPFEAASAAFMAQYRAVFRHALAALFPSATKLRFPETSLFEGGSSATAPDPDDFR